MGLMKAMSNVPHYLFIGKKFIGRKRGLMIYILIWSIFFLSHQQLETYVSQLNIKYYKFNH